MIQYRVGGEACPRSDQPVPVRRPIVMTAGRTENRSRQRAIGWLWRLHLPVACGRSLVNRLASLLAMHRHAGRCLVPIRTVPPRTVSTMMTLPSPMRIRSSRFFEKTSIKAITEAKYSLPPIQHPPTRIRRQNKRLRRVQDVNEDNHPSRLVLRRATRIFTIRPRNLGIKGRHKRSLDSGGYGRTFCGAIGSAAFSWRRDARTTGSAACKLFLRNNFRR